VVLWNFSGHSKGCLWGFPLDFYQISMVFYNFSMGFSLDSYRISMVFLLDVYDMSMVLLLDFYGIPMAFL
jgi:hypothetical protein